VQTIRKKLKLADSPFEPLKRFEHRFRGICIHPDYDRGYFTTRLQCNLTDIYNEEWDTSTLKAIVSKALRFAREDYTEHSFCEEAEAEFRHASSNLEPFMVLRQPPQEELAGSVDSTTFPGFLPASPGETFPHIPPEELDVL
jgi:hypothetical protein